MSKVCRPSPKSAGHVHVQSLQFFCAILWPYHTLYCKDLGTASKQKPSSKFLQWQACWPHGLQVAHYFMPVKNKERKIFLNRKMANLEIGDECASEGGEEAKAHGGSVHSSQPPVLLPHQWLHCLEPHVHRGKCCTGSGAAKDEGTG